MVIKRFLIALAVLLSVFAISGQAGLANLASTPATPVTLTATDILARASEQLADTQTVRFKLEIEGDTYIDPGRTLKLLEAEGELARPDRVRTEFKVVALERATVTVQLIIVSGHWWTTDLVTGEWTDAPVEFEYDPSVLFDNQDGIGPIMDRVENAERLEDDKLDGRKTYHIRAVVDQEIIGPLTSNTIDATPVTVDLWIDQETFELLRARLAEPEDAPGPDRPATWTLDLFDHGATIEIEPPE